jgi:hypothetical protein
MQIIHGFRTSKVGELEVAVGIQKHVFRFEVPTPGIPIHIDQSQKN